MALAVDDRLPAALAEVGVERAHHLPRLLLHGLVARDAAAARRGDLDEGETPAVLGPALEEPPQRADPFRQALRVIHTLDADADELAGDTERRQRGRAVGRPRRDRKSTRLNSSHTVTSYAVFCLKKKKNNRHRDRIITHDAAAK